METAAAPEKHEFPCQQCGASLVFAPGTEHLRCEYCGHEQQLGTENTAPIVEYSFDQARAETRRRPARELGAATSEVRCQGCGAVTLLETKAARCPFCDAPVVLAEAQGELFVPESVLPFAVDRPKAREIFKQWVKTRWFAPNDLVLRAEAEGMDGVYLPYWTYDSRTTTSYTGRRGTWYYVTESYTDSQGRSQNRQVRKTRWWPAFGTVHVDFDDVLVAATRALPRPLLEQLEPWDLHDLRPFEPGYLSGYLANRYDVDLELGFGVAQERMKPVIHRAIERDIGGDEQQVLSMRTKHDQVRFKHFLLPLWISSFRYHERVFRFVVNARTGEAAGERPWSAVKIALAAIAAAIVIGLVVWLTQTQS